MKKLFLPIAVLLCLLLMSAALVDAQVPSINIWPRETIAAGEDVFFSLYLGKNTEQDVYVRILRAEAEDVLTLVAQIKAWDAAEELLVNAISSEGLEPGSYYLTASRDPDYIGISDTLAGVQPFEALAEKLATPVLTRVDHGSTLGTDVVAYYTAPEDAVAVYLQLGYLDPKLGFVELAWEEGYSNSFTVLGIDLEHPGTYQVRVTALTHALNESASSSVADSDIAIYSFTLEAVTDEPPTPTIQLSATEFDWSPDSSPRVTFTLPGAERVAYAWGVTNPLNEDDIGGTNRPNQATDGDSDSVSLSAGPGRYDLYCWGCYHGIWSSSVTGSVTVHPVGYLDAPTVSFGGAAASGQVTAYRSDALRFQASCQDAETLSCEILVRNGTSLDGNDNYDWIDWIDSEGESATFDLSSYELQAGVYRLAFFSAKNGWLPRGTSIVLLDLQESPTVLQSGECGVQEGSLAWSLDSNGQLSITGEGSMADYSTSAPAPWQASGESIHKVVIGEGVTSIGNAAFHRLASLRTVLLPDTLTRIGENAFFRCAALTDISFPASLTEIGSSAFESCTGLTAIAFQGNLTSLGDYAFMSSGLTEVTVADGVAAREWPFFVWNYTANAAQLICVSLPASVPSVDVSCFFATNLSPETPDLILPAELEIIRAEAFEQVPAAFVWLPDSLRSLESNAFGNCPELKFVRIPEGCTSFGDTVFPAGVILLVDADSDAKTYAESNDYPFLELVLGFNG